MMRPSTSSGGATKFPLTFATDSKVMDNSTLSSNHATTATSTLTSNVLNGIINPVFIDHDTLVHVEERPNQIVKEFPPPPPPSKAQQKSKTVDRTDSASSLSSGGSTLITNTSSTGGLLVNNQHNSQVVSECADCFRFHQNKHRIPKRSIYLSPSTSLSYAPYPPQWYYLLAADTKQFRKHRHTHYRRDCRQCRNIVRSTFEQYYLRSNYLYPTTILSPKTLMSPTSTRPQCPNEINTPDGEETTDSMGSISLDHSQPLRQLRTPSYSFVPRLAPSPTFFTTSPSPMSFYKSRASCGHSCLKFAILFYCCIAVIMSICFICYFTRMFGFMSDEGSHMSTLSKNHYRFAPSNYSMFENDSFTNYNLDSNKTVFDLIDTGQPVDSEQPATNLLEIVRAEMIGLLVASAFMIIFILGLIGAFLESVLCLRIFGAILSYLFLLTFGSALYIVILLIISHVALKLILSTISCAAVAITIHGLLAIAPFAFADLITEERNDQLTEAANSTYFKYPSVRFLPLQKRSGRSYFGLGTFGRGWSRPTMYRSGEVGPMPLSNQQSFYRDIPLATSDDSLPMTTPINNHNQGPIDNLSSEGLIPSSRNDTNNGKGKTNGSGQTVRFTDNWM